MRRVVVLFCASGCRQIFGLDSPVIVDASIDATDAHIADAQLCFGISEIEVAFCLASPPSGSVDIPGATIINTSVNNDVYCRPLTSGDYCVIAAESITIPGGNSLAAIGPRSLVLLASTIEIQGTLDVASHIDGIASIGATRGAGSPGAMCNAGTAAKEGAGGQGGSFGTRGGNGGDQDTFPNSRGVSGIPPLLITFQGGCDGAAGGQNSNGFGFGGGAVLLYADEIRMGNGTRINASGSSGFGATPTDNGGSGGGSGGIIVFRSPVIAAAGQIYAHGGAGGGGSEDFMAGASGADSTGATTGSVGGQGGGFTAGDGAPGYPSTTIDGTSGSSLGDGGGGGGGGAGVIRVYGGGSLTGASVSPPVGG